MRLRGAEFGDRVGDEGLTFLRRMPEEKSVGFVLVKRFDVDGGDRVVRGDGRGNGLLRKGRKRREKPTRSLANDGGFFVGRRSVGFFGGRRSVGFFGGCRSVGFFGGRRGVGFFDVGEQTDGRESRGGERREEAADRGATAPSAETPQRLDAAAQRAERRRKTDRSKRLFDARTASGDFAKGAGVFGGGIGAR